MKYLYDNGFTVITMADLGYDENTNQLYIKHPGLTTQGEPGSADEDDNDTGVDMELEPYNDPNIRFGNSEEDYGTDSNEFSESSTGEDNDGTEAYNMYTY
jgi:hypothetical protein